jgi:EmrB/QacA subfamily drug resistance transporter
MNADHPNRKWFTLGAMCFGLFMIMLDNTVVNIALPSIQHSLDATQSELEWCLNSYVLTFAVLILLGGKLGDRFGRKRMFMVGLVIFTAASASCALAPGIGWLIGSRVAQGVGAAILNPLSLSILVNAFPRKQLPTAIGIWAGISGLGLATGPLIGGWLVESVSWSAVFWINVPIGILAFGITFVVVDESRDLRTTKLDLVGTSLITAGLFSLVWALIETNDHSWTSTYIVTFLAAAVVLIAAFIVWELRVDQPMLPLSFFKSRAFTVSNIVVALVGVALFGSLFWITFYLQNVKGYSALEAGVRSMPLTLMILIVAPQAGRFARVFGPRVMMTFGMTLATIGMLGLAQLGVHSSYNHLWPFFSLIGIGMASTMPAVTGTAMGAVDPSRSGIASGVVNAMRQIGGALGIAVLGAVAAQASSSAWQDHVQRLQVNDDVRQRLDAAGGTILSGRSEALQGIAQSLPGQTAARIHEAALQAFVHGMDQALYVGAALTACAAIIAAVAQVRIAPAHASQPAGAVEL